MLNIADRYTDIADAAKRLNALFLTTVKQHPILLVQALLPYLVASLIPTQAAAAVFYFGDRILSRALKGFVYIPFSFAMLYFLILIWAHYVKLAVLCFISATHLHGLSGPIFRTVQLLVLTVLGFSMVHYYVSVFSPGEAYHGITTPHVEDLLRSDPNTFAVPSTGTAIDCLYFSTVTMATVGYGDVYPVNRPAKIATIIQIATSFVLVVVVLGWVIGHAADLAKTSENQAPDDG